MGQIGTIKLQSGSGGVISVPVFALGDSGSNVYEFVRVETAGGTGFIPFTATADATYSYIRIQSQNNGILGVHDAATVSGLSTTAKKDGFEDGDYTSSPDWTASTTGASGATVQTGTVKNGSDALEFDLSAVSSDIALHKAQSRNINDGEILSGWFKIQSGAQDTYYGITQGTGSEPFGATNHAVVNFNKWAEIVANTSGAGATTTNVSWDDGNWHGVELEFDLTNSDMTLRAYDHNVNQEGSVTVNIGFDAKNSDHIQVASRDNDSKKWMDDLAHF